MSEGKKSPPSLTRHQEWILKRPTNQFNALKNVRSTFRSEVIGDMADSVACFRFDPKRYKNPVLVSGTRWRGHEGANRATNRRYNTIGVDLVATCV